MIRPLSPSAKRISVLLGASETIRLGGAASSIRLPLPSTADTGWVAEGLLQTASRKIRRSPSVNNLLDDNATPVARSWNLLAIGRFAPFTPLKRAFSEQPD